jgi:hypothetical protein
MRDLEIEILEILSMSPEPFDVLAKMVQLEDGTSPSPEQVLEVVYELEARGLIVGDEAPGTAGPEGDLEGYVWLSLTDEGRAFAATLPG